MTQTSLLVSTDWLKAHLGDPDLRIVDATVYLRPQKDGAMSVENGQQDYDKGHIPGAVFADVAGALSDSSTPLRFMLPTPDQFASAMSDLGIGDDHRVVIYSGDHVMWATRLWWMFKVFGFDNAAVLDGGLAKWRADGNPLTTDAPNHATASFTPAFRPDLVAARDDVKDAVDDGGTCLLNALPEEIHRGTSPIHYGRPGHITGSVNVSAFNLLDPASGTFLPADDLRSHFAPVLSSDVAQIISYCGGGIAATADAFALALLGQENVSVYDASLQEWSADETLPMSTDD